MCFKAKIDNKFVETRCKLPTQIFPRISSTMPKSVLVTGATGLLGRQVVKAFQRGGWSVTGTGFTRANPPAILKVNLGSEAEVNKVLDEIK